jgi:hypothetical protein
MNKGYILLRPARRSRQNATFIHLQALTAAAEGE